MAANVLLQPIVSEHRLERWEQRTSGEHRIWHTAFCSCGWRTEEHLHQHRVEMTLEVHMECRTAKDERNERRSSLASLTEELLVTVGECERAWREEDRIDTAIRYGR